MRVIITGGTGFIGKMLSNDLAAEGHEVIVLSRSPALAEGLAKTVRVEGWDAKTAKGWGHLADGADAIVNLAGANLAGEGFFPSRWTEARKKIIIDSRVNAGRAVVEAIGQAEDNPSVVIQPSGTNYYGTHPFDVDITEESPTGDDWLAEVCRQWEASTEAVEAMGVRRVVTRSGAVLSFDDGALQRLALPFRFFAGGPMGSGKQPFPWIHPADEIGAIKFLMRNAQASGVFNLTAPEPVTNAQFGHALGRVMGRPSFIPVPGFVISAMFGEAATVVLEGQKVLPEHLQALGYEFKFPNAEIALQNLYGKESAVVA